MLFILEMQSSKKLSSNGVLLGIEWRLEFLNEKQNTIKLSQMAFPKNREMTA